MLMNRLVFAIAVSILTWCTIVAMLQYKVLQFSYILKYMNLNLSFIHPINRSRTQIHQTSSMTKAWLYSSLQTQRCVIHNLQAGLLHSLVRMDLGTRLA